MFIEAFFIFQMLRAEAEWNGISLFFADLMVFLFVFQFDTVFYKKKSLGFVQFLFVNSQVSCYFTECSTP